MAPLKTVFDQIDSTGRGFITKADVKSVVDKYQLHVSSVMSM